MDHDKKVSCHKDTENTKTWTDDEINELCDRVRQIGYEIHMYLGTGYLEKIYENALTATKIAIQTFNRFLCDLCTFVARKNPLLPIPVATKTQRTQRFRLTNLSIDARWGQPASI